MILIENMSRDPSRQVSHTVQNRHLGAAQVRAAHGHDALGDVAVRKVRRHVQVEGVSAEAHPDHASKGRGQAT